MATICRVVLTFGIGNISRPPRVTEFVTVSDHEQNQHVLDNVGVQDLSSTSLEPPV